MKSDGKPHRKLKVWQAGMDFVVELYRELENFPAREQFGLTAQLRRAAVSIRRLEKAVYDHLANKLEEMSMMLNGLIASLAKKI